MRRAVKKLVLSRETVRELENRTLKEVIGDGTTPPPPPPSPTQAKTFECYDQYLRA
jgi:hypothetical protein